MCLTTTACRTTGEHREKKNVHIHIYECTSLWERTTTREMLTSDTITAKYVPPPSGATTTGKTKERDADVGWLHGKVLSRKKSVIV